MIFCVNVVYYKILKLTRQFFRKKLISAYRRLNVTEVHGNFTCRCKKSEKLLTYDFENFTIFPLEVFALIIVISSLNIFSEWHGMDKEKYQIMTLATRRMALATCRMTLATCSIIL